MRSPGLAWLAAPVTLLLACLPHAAHAAASCSFSPSSGGEPALQDVFNDMFGASAAPNTTTSCLADPSDALWHTVSSVGSATILVEIAGNANGNAFGIYDSTSVLNSLQIFSGPAGASGTALITVSGQPGQYTVDIQSISGTTATHAHGTFASSSFGFYLQQPDSGVRLYSESARNPARNGDPTATDYMYSYTGNGATFLNGSQYAPDSVKGSLFDSSDAVIAWEDLTAGSDGDYQDMVVLLRDIVPSASPVPLPAAAWLLGSALLGCGALGRRLNLRSAAPAAA